MPSRYRLLRAAATAVSLTALGAPAPARAQKLGIYFDEIPRICTSTIEPFGPNVHAWVFAFPESADVSGATFRLPLPPDLVAVSEVYPRNFVLEGSGSLNTGVNVTFRPVTPSLCRPGDEAFPILEFELADQWPGGGGPRPDLLLRLEGTGVDSLAGRSPQFKICNPSDPEHPLGVVPATVLDAFLNCTANCACTTELEPATWSRVKMLYQDR